jgi:peptidoglycan/xylan/chitin deacetylase (PgdA/CDA1 family)
MSEGTFIISLDCEGKWGMADIIDAAIDAALASEQLGFAYDELLKLLDAFAVPATFAFVMAFALHRDELERYEDLFADVTVQGGNWLRHFRRQMAGGTTEGWFLPTALEQVRSRAMHEVACHGFSHLPIGDPLVSETAARAEIAAAATIARDKGLELRTFVYPRNLIAHTSVLERAGYLGYRAALSAEHGRTARLGALAEWDATTPSQAHDHGVEPLYAVPSGYFLNWRRGIRRVVPRAWTIRRWRHIIDDAARRGRVAHLWLHPHNIITGPETLGTLEAILRHAAMRREQGQISIMTQQDYCAARRARG